MHRARRIIGESALRMTAAALVCCSGCKVGPDYETPTTQTPARFGEVAPLDVTGQRSNIEDQRSRIEPGQPVWVDWWSKFNDAELDSLVERAVANNHELRIATARLQEARAVERLAESRLYPSLGISAQAAETHGSAQGFGVPYGLPGVTSNLFDVGFDATYEVDLFGGVRRSIEAAGAIADATEDERRGVQVTLLGEVARRYIGLRALQRRLAVARENLADQRRTADIVQHRFDNGLAPNFDVVRAKAQVVATESSIPPLVAGIRQDIHELSVLLGEQPMALSDELEAESPIPPVPPQVPVGLPSELLRRRPDVMRAERVLAAATAEQGVATADLFPHLVLGGAAGVQSRDADQLFRQHEPNSGYYVAGASASWTLFDGGRRSANIDRSVARVAEATSAYEATVIGALRDVENALTAYSADQTRRASLEELVQSDREAVRIARSLYDQGLSPVLDVLEVQRQLHTAEDALAQADQSVSTDLVSLYKALGGGWEHEVPGQATADERSTPGAGTEHAAAASADDSRGKGT